MRILSARIFSKSFGGKIRHGQTDVSKETTFTKKIDMTSRNKIYWATCLTSWIESQSCTVQMSPLELHDLV